MNGARKWKLLTEEEEKTKKAIWALKCFTCNLIPFSFFLHFQFAFVSLGVGSMFGDNMLPSEVRRCAFKSHARLFHLSCYCLCFAPMVPGLPDAWPLLITQAKCVSYSQCLIDPISLKLKLVIGSRFPLTFLLCTHIFSVCMCVQERTLLKEGPAYQGSLPLFPPSFPQNFITCLD